MSAAGERPKRHAPKKLDPDFIVDSSVFSPGERFESPPKKKSRLSLHKVRSPTAVTPGVDVQKLLESQKVGIDIKQELPECNSPQQNVEFPVSAVTMATTPGVTDQSKPSNGTTAKLVLAAKPSTPAVNKVTKMPKSSPKSSPSNVPRQRKMCEKSACSSTRPICFAGSTENCTGNGYTSRWCHLSTGEHFCNNCFENYYRSFKEGYKAYEKWKRVWSTNGSAECNVRNYMADQILPYWLQCTLCTKWRQVSAKLLISPQFVANYQCGHNIEGHHKKEGNKECEYEEDERVSDAKERSWITTLFYTSFLQQSPAAPLMRQYYQDSVGLSPYYNHRERMVNGTIARPKPDTSSGSDSDSSDNDCGSHTKPKTPPKLPLTGRDQARPTVDLPPWSQPFMDDAEDAETAMRFCPSNMTADEQSAFPEYAREQQVYLGIRNLIVTLWNMDCKQIVTSERCKEHLLCRGLVRIRCVQELPRIIKFLSLHGYINTGHIPRLPPELHPPGVNELHVIVIGAGPSGLSVAQHLHNFGAKVTILEAKNHLGGRCHDNMSLGVCIGEGAQIINCSTNNPLSVLCHQLSAKVREIEDRCELIQETGQVTRPVVDRRIDFHFNAMLDNVAEWRKEKSLVHDTNLLLKINEMHKQFLVESQLKFTEEEEKLLQFHLSNLEYACGCCLTNISALHWDQNELYPQFSGPHCFVTDGFTKVFTKLAANLDVKYEAKVTMVDYSGDKVTVTTADGTSYHGDRVVVTVPLAVLKKDIPQFSPPLPDSKVKAIKDLGAGKVEKLALQFPHCFWAEKTKGADFFGHVPDSEADRGLFSIFYDIKPRLEPESSENGPFVLVTYLTGSSVLQMATLSDEKIIVKCMETLQKLFPEQTIPRPIKSFVTHWARDDHISMAYTHLPVGCHGDMYDDLAEMVQEKVHFAGEATNRQFPQSVTGAYMSGLREAYLILTGLELDLLPNSKISPVAAVARKGRKRKNNVLTKNEDVDFEVKSEPAVTVQNDGIVVKKKRGRKPKIKIPDNDVTKTENFKENEDIDNEVTSQMQQKEVTFSDEKVEGIIDTGTSLKHNVESSSNPGGNIVGGEVHSAANNRDVEITDGDDAVHTAEIVSKVPDENGDCEVNIKDNDNKEGNTGDREVNIESGKKLKGAENQIEDSIKNFEAEANPQSAEITPESFEVNTVSVNSSSILQESQQSCNKISGKQINSGETQVTPITAVTPITPGTPTTVEDTPPANVDSCAPKVKVTGADQTSINISNQAIDDANNKDVVAMETCIQEPVHISGTVTKDTEIESMDIDTKSDLDLKTEMSALNSQEFSGVTEDR